MHKKGDFMAAPPRKILLATDLDARSDRAQDRAVSLMRRYDADLIVLHVIDKSHEMASIGRIPFLPYRKPSERRIQRARRRLIDYLGDAASHVKVRIEEGVPHERILRIAREEDCDLIVSGVARNEVLGRFTIGKTVNRLLRKFDGQMLVVTERVRSPYRGIVVLADLSDASKRAIETAASYFPEQPLFLLYAFAASRSSLVDDMEAHREQMRQVAHRDLADFLNTANLTMDQRAHINMLVEFGAETRLLRELVEVSDVELAVVGSRKRGFLLDALLGVKAKRIISSLPCDALIVR